MATINVTTLQSTAVALDYLLIRFNASEPLSGLAYQEIQFSGDLGTLESIYQRVSGDGTTQLSTYARMPSSIGSNGGSIRIRINRLAVTPNLDSDLDVTIRWNAAGTIEILDTADIVYPELAISLNLDYVAAGETITVTFTFSEVGTQLITGFTAADVGVTEGIIKRELVKVSNTEYRMDLRVPATGNGEGVVSVAADRVFPSNTAASATFTYIESIDVELSVSARSIANGGTVLVQANANYDLPNFSGDLLNVSDANASVGDAQALDDENRQWVVPVTVPQQGEGELEITLPEDAIGFSQEAVMAPVTFAPQNAPTITLDVKIRNTRKILVKIGENWAGEAIDITGNNVREVDVQGLLRPFYHEWDANNGKLYIRFDGVVDTFYNIPEVTISATDDDDTITRTVSIEVFTVLPEIKPPDKIQLVKGVKNRLVIPTLNFPTQASADGSYLGLNHSVIPSEGILLEGDVPNVEFGVQRGNLTLNAKNQRGDAQPRSVPWELADGRKPTLLLDSDRARALGLAIRHAARNVNLIALRGDTINFGPFTHLIDALPEATYTVQSSVLPSGVSIDTENHRIVGTIPNNARTQTSFGNFLKTAFHYRFEPLFKNDFGTALPLIILNVLPSIQIPQFVGNIPNINVRYNQNNHSILFRNGYFNRPSNVVERVWGCYYELVGINDSDLYSNNHNYNQNGGGKVFYFAYDWTNFDQSLYVNFTQFKSGVSQANYNLVYKGTSISGVRVRKTAMVFGFTSVLSNPFTINFL